MTQTTYLQAITDTLAEAEAMVMGEPRGVFASRGAMCEPETHGNWAHVVIRRAQAFGVTGTARVSGLRS